jgi:hypothetical protein
MVRAMAIFLCCASGALRLDSRAPNRATPEGGWTERGLPKASTSAGNSPNASTALSSLRDFLVELILDAVTFSFATLLWQDDKTGPAARHVNFR